MRSTSVIPLLKSVMAVRGNVFGIGISWRMHFANSAKRMAFLHPPKRYTTSCRSRQAVPMTSAT